MRNHKHYDKSSKLPVPLRQLLLISITLSFVVQFLIISYNYYSGFIPEFEFSNFINRLFYSTLLSSFLAIVILTVDLKFIVYMNIHFSWHNRAVSRILRQLIFVMLSAILLSSLLTLVSNAISPYHENIIDILISNALITSVINLLIMALLEAWVFFRESRLALAKTIELQKELTGIKFEVLKNQINPHFLFNSLNVLSGLVNRDIQKAQQFIEEFSFVYRYVLETIDKPVVTVNDEIKFVHSYIFLQQIRYGENLVFTMSIPAEILNKLLPPLSLQLLLENAIKHNKIDHNSPLKISIEAEDEYLCVKNNLQPKLSAGKSTGIGLSNLKKRYEMIADLKPEFGINDHEYLARIPLIESE